jgi:hypothetical protein
LVNDPENFAQLGLLLALHRMSHGNIPMSIGEEARDTVCAILCRPITVMRQAASDSDVSELAVLPRALVVPAAVKLLAAPV